MSIQIKAASYEPASPDEHVRGVCLLLPVQDRGGFVFLLGFAKKENSDSELLMQTLMDQTRRLAESFGKEANPQHRFEQFLGALNETLASHVREGRWHVPIDQLHAAVGIVSANEMYLSGTGELTALFLHRKPSQRYQVFNLFRGLQTEQALPTWEKPFAVVLDGDLHPGDVFCLCDKDLQGAIASDELNQILSSLPPRGAVEKIRQYFSHKDGLLLTVVKVDEPLQGRQVMQDASATPTSQVSVNALNDTQRATDRLLEDQRPNLASMVKRLISLAAAKADQRSQLLRNLSADGGAKHLARKAGRLLWRVLLLMTHLTRKHLARAWRLAKNREDRTRVKKRLQIKQRHMQGAAQSFLHRVRAVPRSTRYLVGGILLAVVILGLGISAISKSQARSVQETAYQEQVLAIEDLLEQGAGAIIYKDENRARGLYLNAGTLLEALPIDTPERVTSAQKLTANLQAALNDIRHLVTIPNPPLLADLETLTDGVFGNGLMKAPDGLFAAGSDGRLYRFVQSEKRFEVAASPSGDLFSPVAASQEDGRLYLLDADGVVHGISLEDGTISPIPLRDDRWVDLQAYANRLYLLRPGADGQIDRFERTGASFANPSEWITSRTLSLEQAVALTIDGSVYILMRDGSIGRFDNGSEEGWGVGAVDPSITGATKIWTDAQSAFLYVMEPSTQRLMVFDKASGAFVLQYRSEAFQGLTDFIVDEAGYTIYLMAGSKLYSIAPSHLN